MVGSEHWESASCDPEEFRLPLPRYLLDLITKTLQVLVVDYERKGPAADMCATRFRQVKMGGEACTKHARSHRYGHTVEK